MAHPWSSDIFPKSAKEDGAVAKRREERKMDKYRKVRLPGGSMVKVTPLVLEHFGRWGEEGKKFLQIFRNIHWTKLEGQMHQSLLTIGGSDSQDSYRSVTPKSF